MTLICGIDEAGRGPVLGPLVMAGVVIQEEKVVELEKLGVKDSKLLSFAKREELYDKILDIVDAYELFVIGHEVVDHYVTSPDVDKNLNWLEAEHAAMVIDKLRPTKAILDCPSTNITAFSQFVRRKLKHKEVHLVCEHKADMNYVVVGAASILAKVVRDRKIEELKKEVGINFGSGYPSDPKTQAFLQSHWDKCTFFRKSWSSWQKMKEGKMQKKLGDW
jgi:ribonuclease HII